MLSLKLLSHNALRLYQDAQLLFENDRYPTSLSLSLLSIEEAGKFFLKRDQNNGDKISNVERLHVHKQEAAFHWLFVEESIVTFFDVLNDFGFEHKPYLEMTELQRKWLGSTEGRAFDKRLRSDEILNIVMDAVSRRMNESGMFADMQGVTTGEVNKLKQLGLYLDAGADNNISNLPYNIAKTEAAKWLNRAKRAANLTRIYSRDEHPERYFSTAPKHSLLEQGFQMPF